MSYKIPSIGYEILDHCNLNCKHCCHFSQLKPKKEKPVEEIIKDVKFLCDHIDFDEFKISGGEPLIHSDICNVVKELRRTLGSRRILLLTNGIKLFTMPDEFFMMVKYLGIHVDIAKYPIKAKYDEAEAKLKERGIPYSVVVVTHFGNIYKRMDPEGKQDPADSFKYCRTRQSCPYYNDGKIYICRATINVPFLNEKFGYQMEGNGVDVTDSEENIHKYLTSPCLTCRFCKRGIQLEPWETL